MSPPDRRMPAWALPAGLAVLVITLVAIALMRGPVTFDPGTPEGTVQEYLLAIDDERWDDAIEIVHAHWRGSCQGADLAAYAPTALTAEIGTPSEGSGPDLRGPFVAELERNGHPLGTEPVDRSRLADVEVTIVIGDSGLFGSGWSEYALFELYQDDGFWWLVGEPWPNFTWDCAGSV